jgi:hypothetical protein
MSGGFSVAGRKSDMARSRRDSSKNPLNFDEGTWGAAFAENGGPQYVIFFILAVGGTVFCALTVYNIDGHLHYLWLITILFWLSFLRGALRLLRWLVRVRGASSA